MLQWSQKTMGFASRDSPSKHTQHTASSSGSASSLRSVYSRGITPFWQQLRTSCHFQVLVYVSSSTFQPSCTSSSMRSCSTSPRSTARRSLRAATRSRSRLCKDLISTTSPSSSGTVVTDEGSIAGAEVEVEGEEGDGSPAGTEGAGAGAGVMEEIVARGEGQASGVNGKADAGTRLATGVNRGSGGKGRGGPSAASVGERMGGGGVWGLSWLRLIRGRNAVRDQEVEGGGKGEGEGEGERDGLVFRVEGSERGGMGRVEKWLQERRAATRRLQRRTRGPSSSGDIERMKRTKASIVARAYSERESREASQWEQCWSKGTAPGV
mmetsp:Transcript_3549/g.5400  ORF Transcript_3549/g.5400 Transcript_3549/m.5400 type:complete len:324 (-) Transcript_3549:1274-2245(-)